MMHTKEWLLPIVCLCKLLVPCQEGIIITVDVYHMKHQVCIQLRYLNLFSSQKCKERVSTALGLVFNEQ